MPLIVSFVLGLVLVWVTYQYFITNSLMEEYRYKYSITSQLISCEAHEKIISQQASEIEELQKQVEELGGNVDIDGEETSTETATNSE